MMIGLYVERRHRLLHNLRRTVPHHAALMAMVAISFGIAGFEVDNRNVDAIRKGFAEAEKEVFVDVGGRKIAFCYVPAGQFTMGSPASEDGHEGYEEPARIVKLTKPFYLSKYEVTQADYKAITQGNPSRFKGENLPCHSLRYKDAMEFCENLSEFSGVEISIPTEAQWEYACRAGTQTRFYDTEDDLRNVAWYRANSDERPHPVGEKKPNAFGLYDMHGNVEEFCLDFMGDFGYEDLPDVDPIGKVNDDVGSLRGGTWHSLAESCRSASRSRSNLLFGSPCAGIRLIINADENADKP